MTHSGLNDPVNMPTNPAYFGLAQAAASKTIQKSNFTMTSLSAESGASAYNASFFLNALLSGGYTGSLKMYYTRRDLATGIPGAASISLSGVTTKAQLISAINAATGLVLVDTDINNLTIPNGATSVVITAASTSWFFVPGTTITIGT